MKKEKGFKMKLIDPEELNGKKKRDIKVLVVFVIFTFLMVASLLGILLFMESGQKLHEGIDISNAQMIGDPEAKVVIVEYSDYQCPHCKDYTNKVFPIIKRFYIDTGKILYVHKQAPITNMSVSIAEISECAEDRFWDYHLSLHNHTIRKRNVLGFLEPQITIDSFLEIGRELEMNTTKFLDCVIERRYQDQVEKDLAEAHELGITGVPTFYIGDQIVEGALPYQDFKKVIDDELNRWW